MLGSFQASFAVLLLLFGSALATDAKQKSDSDHSKTGPVTVTKIDAKQGVFTVKYTDNMGKTQEKTFRLTNDVRLLDEKGQSINLAVFQSGDEVLLVESEGKLQEIRRTPNGGQPQRISDTIKTLIEMAEVNQAYVQDLQDVYDMLRKLDTGKDGKIDSTALKAAADQIVQERVKMVFARLDADKDGKISKEEARGLIKEHFDRIDTNKNGLIEFEELLQAARQRQEQKASEAIPHKQK
jgi:Ca2+-binding EF-hand superfamily protein